MIKNRHIPFGYKMEIGIIKPHDIESSIVKNIFNNYLKGSSLKTISDHLSAKGVEYLPGVNKWNKNRIKRILEDKRYTGDNIYPAIISEQVFTQAEKIKNQKNEKKEVRETDIYSILASPVLCECCKTEMKRYHDKRLNPPQRWRCKNADCNAIAYMNDSEFGEKVKEIFFALADNINMVNRVKPMEYKPSLDVMRMTNDIARVLENYELDREQTKNLIFECAVQKYKEIDMAQYITYQLKIDLEKAKNTMPEFNKQLFYKIVSKIVLSPDNRVKLVLKNNQEVGGE